MLKCFTRFFVQNEESKRLLEGIGITAVDVVGDTRFDRVLQIKEAAKQLPICEAFRTGVASSQSADVPHHDSRYLLPVALGHQMRISLYLSLMSIRIGAC